MRRGEWFLALRGVQVRGCRPQVFSGLCAPALCCVGVFLSCCVVKTACHHWVLEEEEEQAQDNVTHHTAATRGTRNPSAAVTPWGCAACVYVPHLVCPASHAQNTAARGSKLLGSTYACMTPTGLGGAGTGRPHKGEVGPHTFKNVFRTLLSVQ